MNPVTGICIAITRIEGAGQNPFSWIPRTQGRLQRFINSRFVILPEEYLPEIAEEMFKQAEEHATERYANYKRMASADYSKE